ncbi:MAG: ATP-binding cassette domain-containing protein [Bdellovibrio sp.]|nr:ATP-binding cassette domain-containing protein [Bdellovibrio sp.]
MTIAVEFKNLNKTYGAVKACQDISFKIKRGDIHALVGENGAGKSTLMNLLGGLEQADRGEILVHEKAYHPTSAKEAFACRIGFIHQHFLLADNLTVLQHLILNWPGQKLFSLFSNSKLLKKVETFVKKFNWTIDLHAKINQLSVGEQQCVEIIKALLANPDIIIFDEPTAVLAPQEITHFLNFLKQLKSEGKTIILISHKLTEIQEVADQLTILRHGRCILTSETSKLSLLEIAENMIGQKLVYAKDEFQAIEKKQNLIFIKKISLPLRRNEILGVAGIEGHGQGLLIQLILTEAKANSVSFADIPEDRLKFALFEGMSLRDHMILRHPQLSQYGFIRKKHATAVTQKIVEDWDVRPRNIDLLAGQFSGGNQQKFVIGRELFHHPELVLAAHPTRGVDLGAQQMIHAALIKQRADGKAVVLVSSDLDEVLKLSDQYVILYKLKLFGPFKKQQLSETEIGQFMTGSHPHQKKYQLGALT